MTTDQQIGHPDIRFCRSRDGTRLAFTVCGTGRPIVMVPLHFGEDLDAPSLFNARHWVEGLSGQARVVRYDVRGCGYSDSNFEPSTLESWADDLDAIVRVFAPEPVTLLAISHGALPAARYANLHPQQVSHLIVVGGSARGRSRRGPNPALEQETRAQREAMASGWGFDQNFSAAFRRVFYSRTFPGATDAQLAEIDATMHRRWSADCLLAYSTAVWQADVSADASKLSCPSLVLHSRDDQVVPLDEGRRLAALIPGARFVTLSSAYHMLPGYDGEWPRVLAETKSFLGLADQFNDLSALTPRQIEVLRLVSKGHTDKEIARNLQLSPRTVEMHVGRALAALQCHTRAEAVRFAAERGLFSMPD
ncbi:hypothetical protein GCM10027034_27200 [Ramlibacter solisilvae]|uniref:HTH luxR-type domain-containing protein n=1 Tax=Ramlibacter tataouinensis TaxID=94132 RepID=A0A127JQX8_9BURK|nr:alpha/beta fold hydrolase [Ramlibacter tataouinensis]AMO22376.1 hypothetical protein UC35_05020 [Ramlibacter tataouinensis]